jgi:hypothetical protein
MQSVRHRPPPSNLNLGRPRPILVFPLGR